MPTHSCTSCNVELKEEERITCARCLGDVCANCTVTRIPNRHNTGICATCDEWLLVSPCGRCSALITNDRQEFYCEMCGLPICLDCVQSSFECGVLKCAGCCPSPITQEIQDSDARYLVSEDVLSSVVLSMAPSPARAAASAPVPPIAAASTFKRDDKYRHMKAVEKLGEGAQGIVRKCKTSDGDEVVLKEMKFSKEDEGEFNAHLRQARSMQQLNHPHIIRYLDAFEDRDPLRVCVVMPYYSEGDLAKFIFNQRGAVAEYKLCSLVLQIAEALNYLHTLPTPLVHRDVKPENILLLNDDQVLLMDLDLCSSAGSTASVMNRRRLSPTYEYKAPELSRSRGDTKADVFSLGVVTFVLATLPEYVMIRGSGTAKYALSAGEWTKKSLTDAIYREMGNVRPVRYSKELQDLTVEMLYHDPAERPSAKDVVRRLKAHMEKLLLPG